MSRILRRPMFRGGLANEGIMSVPRKGYSNGTEEDEIDYEQGLFNNSSDLNLSKTGSITYTPTGLKDSDSRIDPSLIKKEVQEIKDKPKTYKLFGQTIEEGSYGDILAKEYLGNRPDPLGKFLIQFGLNYMSARPKGGRFGALATAAEAAKKPTEQLYADVDTDRLLKLKLMSAIGKSESKGAFEKKVNFVWSQELEKPKESRIFKSKQEVTDYYREQESRQGSSNLKDYSDVALIRKFGEDWGKENRVNSSIQRLNVGKFRLKLEKGEIDKEILGNLPSKGSEIIITEDYNPKKDNPKILEINPSSAQDYQTGKIYVNPVDKQFYIVQGEGNKKTFFGIGKYY
jgi:hypothetical protein